MVMLPLTVVSRLIARSSPLVRPFGPAEKNTVLAIVASNAPVTLRPKKAMPFAEVLRMRKPSKLAWALITTVPAISASAPRLPAPAIPALAPSSETALLMVTFSA